MCWTLSYATQVTTQNTGQVEFPHSQVDVQSFENISPKGNKGQVLLHYMIPSNLGFSNRGTCLAWSTRPAKNPM